jgi:hypothetical protein
VLSVSARGSAVEGYLNQYVRHFFYKAIFAPGKRLAVPFRVDFTWFVLPVVLSSRGMTTSNLTFRWFAAVETHHNFVAKHSLRFELKNLRTRRELVN